MSTTLQPVSNPVQAHNLWKAGLLWYSAQDGSILPYNWKPTGDTLPSACANYFTFYVLTEE